MQRREHAAQRGEVAAALQVELLEQDEGLAVADAAIEHLRDADVRAQGLEPVRFGGERVGARRRAFLQKPLHAQPDVRRVFARLRRSTRMPMKARSKLLRQATVAFSRSAMRMRTTCESFAVLTVAPRSRRSSER